MSELTLAIIGTEEKQEFFLYGDAPDVAEKLEADSKNGCASKIIVDEAVYGLSKENYEFIEFESQDFPKELFFELVITGEWD